MANLTGLWKVGEHPDKAGLYAILEAGNGSWHRVLRGHGWWRPQAAQPIVNAHNAALQKLAAELRPEAEEPAAMEQLAAEGNLFAQMDPEAREDAAERGAT